MVRRKSERIRLLQKLASQYEQLAAQDLGRSTNNLLSQQGRLEQLKKFREDYKRQFNELGRQGMDGTTIMAFQNFLQQLDTAIVQQQQVVVASQSENQQQKSNWQDKHTTTRVYDKTLERTLSKEARQDNRKQQSETDDLVQHRKPGDDQH